jgi:hypothetical protein
MRLGFIIIMKQYGVTTVFSMGNNKKRKEQKKEKRRNAKELLEYKDHDDTFAFIAGYTEWEYVPVTT